MQDPELLILGYPTWGVDVGAAAAIRQEIIDLAARGCAVIVVSEDLDELFEICDRIAVMFRGNIVEMGAVEQVLMEPKHPYTRLLIESIPEADPNRRWSSRVTLSELEQEEYLREGCKFAGRCPEVMDKCKSILPADILVDDVLVKCHLYNGN